MEVSARQGGMRSLGDKDAGGLCETRRHAVSERQGGRWSLRDKEASGL
jgi:hypothetical protein